MIYKLGKDNYENVRKLFEEFKYQLSVNAVIDQTLDGEIYVDNIESPKSAYITTPEGELLVGDSDNVLFNQALKKIVPFGAYLQFEPSKWEEHLSEIWMNTYVWKESRTHMLIQSEDFKLTQWRRLLPETYTLHKIDKIFLEQSFKNMNGVVERVKDWGDVERFEELAFGYCIVWKESIVTRCISDNVHLDQTEVGIWTHKDHRGKGLAGITLAAVVEHCFAKGFNKIGWHSLTNNIGSIKTALKVGFKISREYYAYGTDIPAESQNDLTKEEWVSYATKYDEMAINHAHPIEGVNYIYAAAAWALAGDAKQSINYLYKMINSAWKNDYSFLKEDWKFWSLHETDAWKTLINKLDNLELNYEV